MDDEVLSYHQIMSLDDVAVEILPEKKGVLMKHTEYLVKSLAFDSSVPRRYTDFEVFYELLIARFPYRLVPKLPPKKIGMTENFITKRRSALARFLNIISRHPVLRRDPIVLFFLTIEVHDFHIHMKDKFKNLLDEFVTNPDKNLVSELLNKSTGDVVGMKEELGRMLSSVITLRDLAERWVSRSTQHSYDLQLFSNELSVLAGEGSSTSAWSSHQGDSWAKLREGMRGMATQFSSLSDRAGLKRRQEDCQILDNISYLLDVLQGMKDLVDRRERGVNKEHALAFNRVQQLKKQKGSLAAKGQGGAATLQEKIEQQESLIGDIQIRNNFSILCVHWEMRLMYSYLSHFGVIWSGMVNTQLASHGEMACIWEKLRPLTNLMISTQSYKPGAMQPSAPPIAFTTVPASFADL